MRQIRRVEYFHTTVKDSVGAGYRLLAELAAEGVNLVAFNAVPIGPTNVQMMLFPEDSERLVRTASKTGLVVTGPNQALLIQGNDRLGALAEIHRKLFDAGVSVYSSTALTSGEGGYGYLIYVRPEDIDKATATLEA